MRFSSYLFALIAAFALVEASRRSSTPRIRGRPLKQATRSQIVRRAARPQGLQRRQQASPLPIPTINRCSGFTPTGSVPYARFVGLDYDALPGATSQDGIPTREACTKICELDNTCTSSTYNTNTQSCFTVRSPGTFRTGAYDVTLKNEACESSTNAAAQASFPQATCCNEYRQATPA